MNIHLASVKYLSSIMWLRHLFSLSPSLHFSRKVPSLFSMYFPTE